MKLTEATTSEIQQFTRTPKVVELVGAGCAWKALARARHKTDKSLRERFFIASAADVSDYLGVDWKVRAY